MANETSLAFTSAGTTFSISATQPATYDAAGFNALTWTLVGEVTDMGEFGKKYNLVTHNPLGSRKTFKRKGSYDNGQMALQMARTPTDSGQTLIRTALDSDDSYAFKTVLQDGTILYGQGQVMSYTTNVGSTEQITAASVEFELDGDIIEV